MARGLLPLDALNEHAVSEVPLAIMDIMDQEGL
jgi:hypothetical protein